MIVGTKTEEMRSARRWTGAFVAWASVIIWPMWASWVSEPTAVARTIKAPEVLRVPPVTALPGDTSRGRDSPVISEVSSALVPSSTMPSVAILSPGRTWKRSPTASSEAAMVR